MNRKQGTPLTPRSQNNIPGSTSHDKVKVLLRVRPFLATQDPQQFISLVDDNLIQIRKLGMASMMKFNYVQIQTINQNQRQNSETNQVKMYSYVQQTVQNMFEGIDGTIFAYGQTGAGKTYTIIGNCPQSPQNVLDLRPFLLDQTRGILVRAMEQILSTSRRRKDCRITLSFFQIYNQKIFDLLTSNPKPLQIREVKNGEVSIPGLIRVEILDMKEALNYIGEGLRNRVTSSTAGNIKSSRSHSVFHIKCQRLKIDKNNQHQIIVSNLRIVDLAGSEKFNIPKDLPASERQIRLVQLKSINGSLSKLGHCISALTKQNRTHIPFRDSKLTRILRQSLLGPSKIRLIVCISPSTSAMNQTSSTLQFADSVKKAIFGRPVSPTPQKKKMIEQGQYQAILQELQKQKLMRTSLERMIQTLHCHPAQIQLVRQNDRLRQQVTMLKEELKVYQNKVKIAGLSLSRSRSKTPKPGQKSPVIKKYQPPKSIAGTKKLNGTPPKKVSPRSVIEHEHRHSIDTGYDRDISQRQSSNKRQNANSINYSRQPKSAIFQNKIPTKKQSFENKIRRFMQKNDDNDRQLEQKVKQRLLQIRKQIVQNREWGNSKANDSIKDGIFEDNIVNDSLWQKPSFHK